MLIHGDYTSSHLDKTVKPVMILTGDTPFKPSLVIKEKMMAKHLGKVPSPLKLVCGFFYETKIQEPVLQDWSQQKKIIKRKSLTRSLVCKGQYFTSNKQTVHFQWCSSSWKSDFLTSSISQR